MQYQFLCPHHTDKIRANESNALQSWNDLMSRGLDAYITCRLNDAHSYLNATLEIALIRHSCKINTLFNDLHITKPVSFLVEMYLAEDEFQAANTLLQKTQYLFRSQDTKVIKRVLEEMKTCQNRVERSEQKNIFSQHDLLEAKKNFVLNNTSVQAQPPLH